jgi:23S rRNA G2069 N7-methylase RlmK/C1962 C5-methylase RlmI
VASSSPSAPGNWTDSAIQSATQTLREMQNAGINDECCRVVERHVAGFVAERFGPCLWIAWHRSSGPTPSDAAAVESLAHAVGCEHWMIDEMVNRGDTPNATRRLSSSAFPKRWTAKEADARYILRSDRGQAPGLFLDQRTNRREVAASSRDARVLNLFAYTCSFSVVAALGGASQIVSVDASGPFLDWGKENFQLNGLERTQDAFWKGDVRDFLKLARKRAERFDLIILDPPTFSRSRQRPFNVRKELSSLSEHCLELLAPRGQMLVSTNLSSWTRNDLAKMLASIARGASIRSNPLPIGIAESEHTAKSCWVSRTTG